MSRNEDHRVLWRIENFSECINSRIASPSFRTRGLDESLWTIFLSPKDETDNEYISVNFFRPFKRASPEYVHVEIDMCVIDLDGEERFNQSFFPIVKQVSIVTFHRFVRRRLIFENKRDFLPNDVLTLRLQMRKHVSILASKSVLRTEIHVERSSFLWRVPCLATRKAMGNKRVTRVHSSMAPNGYELLFECVEPKTTGSEHLFRLAVKLKNVPTRRLFMSATILALDSHLKPSVKIAAEHFFEAKSSDAWHLPNFHVGDISEGLPDLLDLVCNFALSNGSQDNQRKADALINLPVKEANTVRDDIRSAFEDPTRITPDITLDVCNGMQRFQVHKTILSARSLAFRKMLNNLDVEKKRCFDRYGSDANVPTMHVPVLVKHKNMTAYVANGMDCAQILDTCPSVMDKVIKLMYTDTLDPDDVINATQLYTAAEEFGFELLREKSEKYLMSKISLKSLYTILRFAHRSNIVQLKFECLEFISMNREIVLASREWDFFTIAHKKLAQEVLDMLRLEN